MKFLRIILAVLGGAIVLLVVAAVILVNTFDPNDYKDEITAYVQEHTGRTLAIDKDIELSLFPWFAVETGGVSLSDDPAFSSSSFVTIDKLSARIRVWPLLKHRVEIGRVVLDGIDLNLGVDSEGRGNWTTLLPQTSAEASAAGATTAAEPRIRQLAVEGIELKNARIRWHDANNEVRYLVRDFKLTTGPIHDTDPVDVSLELSLLDVPSQATARIELSGVASVTPELALRNIEASVHVLDAGNAERAAAEISLDSLALAGSEIRAGPVELMAHFIDPPIGADRLDASVSIRSIALDRASERLRVEGLAAKSGDIEADFDLAGEAMLSAPQLTGRVSANGPSLAALFDTLGVAADPTLGDPALGGFAANGSFTVGLSPLSLTLDPFALSTLGVDATGTAALAGDGTLRAHLELPGFAPSASLGKLVAARLPAGVDTSSIHSASLSADLSLPPTRKRLAIDNLALALDATRLGGSLALSKRDQGMQVEGTITASGLDNAQLAALFGPWLPNQLLEADLGSFRARTSFSYAADTGLAMLDPVELTAYGLSGDGQLSIETAGPALAVSGQARLAPFSPRALLTRFALPAPASSDPKALGKAELAASFETTGSDGHFRDIALMLDDSRITGEFSVENFADPTYRFVLRADRIDADRYLPPKSPGPAPAPAAAAAASSGAASGAASVAASGQRRLGDIRLAGDALSATRLTGSVSVGELTLGGLSFEQLAADIKVGAGQLRLSSVKTRLYGGDFTGGFAVDASTPTPSAHLAGQASRVALEPMLGALLGSSYLTGTGSFDIDLEGTGATVGNALQTAAGKLDLKLENGRIAGFNLDRSLCTAFNAADKQPPPANAPDVTPYAQLSAEATVKDGTASTPELFAKTAHFEGTGKGTLRLVDARASYDLRLKLVSPIPIGGCDRINTQVGNSVPFTLTGVLPDVKLAPDLSEYLRDRARDAARDAVRDRVGDALRGLIN